MTIRVVSEKTFQVNYHTCKSVLEFGFRDIMQRYVSDYLGDRELQKIVNCPVCKNPVSVKRL